MRETTTTTTTTTTTMTTIVIMMTTIYRYIDTLYIPVCYKIINVLKYKTNVNVSIKETAVSFSKI